MNILITGAAGYIGSHLAKQLLESTKHNITILDNLSTGSLKTLDTLRSIRDFKFVELDLKEFDKVLELLKDNNFDVIMHFAASIVVPESVENPLKYYMNNTVNTTNLIKCATEADVQKFIFSSTAAVYGEPKDMPNDGIDENSLTAPINPYGMSKLMSERVLQDATNAKEDFKYVIFRYFNVTGADIYYDGDELKPRIGQSFPDATHLIKIASECAVGKRDKMAIFGDNFDTPDGSGVRDYIHVDDLVAAHIKAINYLDNNASDIFNLGYGKGFSVKEVIDTMKEVTSTDFDVEVTSKRVGDPANLIANNNKYKSKFSTKNSPLFKYDDIKLICKSAYLWENSL
ncbi:MAG: UDP-glucose 4-epimerase GalE [Campylobacterota bacterium]|nr:UDP-glucose 4-epimerase GalE [Campylobacterota bacterium]